MDTGTLGKREEEEEEEEEEKEGWQARKLVWGFFVGSEIEEGKEGGKEGGREGGRALMRGEKGSGVGEKKRLGKTH